MTTIDYYELLGISKDATQKQIKDAYRALAFRFHPDRSGNDPGSAEKMKQLNEAYAVLSNEDKRRQYDALRQQYGSDAHQQFRRTYSDQDIFKDSDVWRVFEEMSKQFGFRGFEDVFRPFYGPGFQHFQYQRPGLFLKGFFFMSPFGWWGGSKQRNLPDGNRPGFLSQGLREGLRRLVGIATPKKKAEPAISQKGADRSDTIQITPNLSATGGAYAYFHKLQNKKLIVKIPPGIRDGQRIRLSGLGDEGTMGAPAGDLYLKVQVHQTLSEKVMGFISGLFKKT